MSCHLLWLHFLCFFVPSSLPFFIFWIIWRAKVYHHLKVVFHQHHFLLLPPHLLHHLLHQKDQMECCLCFLDILANWWMNVNLCISLWNSWIFTIIRNFFILFIFFCFVWFDVLLLIIKGVVGLYFLTHLTNYDYMNMIKWFKSRNYCRRYNNPESI